MVFHEYETADPAVRATALPRQTLVFLLTDIVAWKTFTATVASLVHPFDPVPVTVYTLDVVGLNWYPAVLGPFVHTYVLAPPAVRLTVDPMQTSVLLAEAEVFGEACVTTTAVPSVEHPNELNPKTLYEVEDCGLTVTTG